METRDTEQKEITEKFINQAIEGHRAHDLNWKRIPGFNAVSYTHLDVYKRQNLALKGAGIFNCHIRTS